MDLEDVSYSREATIAAVADYYTFLTRMYMHESHVVYPPPGGWPEIVGADPALLQSFGKSDEVLALLAHLPYICHPDGPGLWDRAAEPLPGRVFANWPALFGVAADRGDPDGDGPGRVLRINTEGFELCDLSPPHVVGLTFAGPGGADVLLLDTELGIVHWGECESRIQEGPWGVRVVDWELDDEVSSDEADWRHSSPAWAISDFFEVLKDQFRLLHWVPISHYTVESATVSDYPRAEGWLSVLVDLYRQHGWPDLTAYSKENCIAAVLNAVEERYPEYRCSREGGISSD